MNYKIYRPLTDDVTTNLWDVDVADLTADVLHEIEAIDNKKIAEAERITIQIDWADLSHTNAVFFVKTRVDNELSWVNEQSDEDESNATQKTLGTAAGSHIFHFVPANYQGLLLNLDRNSIVTGSVSVSVSVKW